MPEKLTLKEAMEKIDARANNRMLARDKMEAHQEDIKTLRSVPGAWVDVRIDKTKPLSYQNCAIDENIINNIWKCRNSGSAGRYCSARCPATILNGEG